jgi:hypothetical protein
VSVWWYEAGLPEQRQQCAGLCPHCRENCLLENAHTDSCICYGIDRFGGLQTITPRCRHDVRRFSSADEDKWRQTPLVRGRWEQRGHPYRDPAVFVRGAS